MKTYLDSVLEYDLLFAAFASSSYEERLDILMDMGEIQECILYATCHISKCVEDNFI